MSRRSLSRRVIVEALAELARARLRLKLQPFEKVVATKDRQYPAADPAMVREIQKVLDAWSRRLPWKPVCFDRALAAERMLSRRGCDVVLHYGSRRGADGLEAHVWVSSGDMPVIGYDNAQEFVELARYPAKGKP